MPKTDETRSPSDELLTAGLRRLARSSPQEAAPELEDVLTRAFHRHHRSRRLMRAVAIAAVVLAIGSASLWLVPDHRPSENQVAAPLARLYSSDAREVFLPLPSFAFVAPEEDLRVIRVEMPAYSLRQLGARVNDDLITHRVVADLLVGADGTPYAFRLVG